MNTEEVLLEPSEEETRKKLKSLLHWKASDNFLNIKKKCDAKADKLLEQIKEEFETRKKIEQKKSEADKLGIYIEFVKYLYSLLDKSEGAEIIKEEFNRQLLNAYTHLWGRVEIGFDVPVFSKLDFLKEERNMNLTVEKRFDEIIKQFDVKEEAQKSLHPYEEN